MAGFAGGPAETIRALREMDEEFVRAVAARDPGRLVGGFYSEDARLLPEERTAVAGEAAIREFWEGMFAAGLTGVALDTMHVEVSGNLAYSVGEYAAVVEPPRGQGSRIRGKYLVVYRRQDATRWRAVVHMFSNDGAQG
jgi:ketosteroid isomerase-like protein